MMVCGNEKASRWGGLMLYLMVLYQAAMAARIFFSALASS
jgi:hypothetical protein